MGGIYPVVLAIGAFVSTLTGGLLVVRAPRHFRRIVAFAAGVLVAVPLFELLPEALSLAFRLEMPTYAVMYAVGAGFVFLMIISRYAFAQRAGGGNACRNSRHLHAGLAGSSELVAHSFLDGFAIGLGFHVSAHVGTIVALAVIAHDFSDGINTVTLASRPSRAPRVVYTMLLLDAIAPVAGAVAALFVVLPTQVLVVLLAFFSGGFLYLGASDLLPEAYERNRPSTALLLSLSGFFLILLLSSILGVSR